MSEPRAAASEPHGAASEPRAAASSNEPRRRSDGRRCGSRQPPRHHALRPRVLASDLRGAPVGITACDRSSSICTPGQPARTGQRPLRPRAMHIPVLALLRAPVVVKSGTPIFVYSTQIAPCSWRTIPYPSHHHGEMAYRASSVVGAADSASGERVSQTCLVARLLRSRGNA